MHQNSKDAVSNEIEKDKHRMSTTPQIYHGTCSPLMTTIVARYYHRYKRSESMELKNVNRSWHAALNSTKRATMWA